MIARPPAVAGLFYPGEPASLGANLDALLAMAPAPMSLQPKALIVPHAGYIYSGAIAATAYAMLTPWAHTIRRVVLLGPTHRVAVSGLALPERRAFATPLGEVPVDQAAIASINDLPQVLGSDLVHAQEHSIEVHLPFLQRVLEDFTLVPLAVGNAPPEAVAEVIERLWGGPETLIVVSSDLSHFLDYAEANRLDEDTCRRIQQFDTHLHPRQACGAAPLNGLLLAARRRGLRVELLAHCNSGDTAGDRERVVGYAAFALTQPPPVRSRDALGLALLKLARAAIAGRLGQLSVTATANLPELERAGASFVTLTQDGRLRGCIGSLQAHRPLREDVRENALAAAFRDPRFAPLEAGELTRTRVEVSLLTAPEPMSVRDEADALAQLEPGRDGLILSTPGHRATFLPQVWEQLPQAAQFLRQLKLKAGLPADYWGDDVRLERYRVEKWKE